MKNKSLYFAAIATIVMAVGATGCKSSAAHDVTVVDLTAATSDTTAMSHVKITDVAYTPLDTATAALLNNYCNIVGVAGDTIILADNNNSVKLFSLSDGRMVGHLSHVGNGPGEYSWIETVYPDIANRQLVIKGARGAAHRYTFGDSLVESYPAPRFPNRRLAIGSLNTCIYLLEPTDKGDVIRVLDKNFSETDSILLPDYNLGYYAGIFWQDGDRALVSMADTVYEIKPDRLEKVLITDRHGRYLSPEKETESYRMSFDEQMNFQDSFIKFFSLIIGGDYILIPASFDKNSYLLIFDKNDGTLLARTILDENSIGLEAEWKGITLPVMPQFYADGRFYAIIGEDYAVGPNGELNDGNLNSGVVSFRLEK